MQIDRDAIRCVITGLVKKDMAARNEKEPILVCKEKARGVSEFELSGKRLYPNRGEEQCFYHCSVYQLHSVTYRFGSILVCLLQPHNLAALGEPTSQDSGCLRPLADENENPWA